MIAVGAGMIGFWYRKINWMERIIVVIVGLLLMYPEGYSDIIGFVAFIAMLVIQIMTKDKNRDQDNNNLQKASNAN